MPELKKMFSAAKMNKDLDERLVPQGEYRDATNIEISTSEGSNSGVVQTLKGNTRYTTMSSANGYYDIQGGYLNTGATCVGSIATSDRDKIYYFVHSDKNTATGAELDRAKDYILEFDTVNETIKYVFVDIYRVNSTIALETSNTNDFLVSNGAGVTTNQTGIRVGMNLLYASATSNYNLSDNIVTVTDISYDTTANQWKVTVNKDITLPADADVRFVADRVLEFNYNNLITAINILDDFLFWTDNEHEPKKIHIKRSMLGTGGTEYLQGAGNTGISGSTNAATNNVFAGDTPYFHTRLVVDHSGVGDAYEIVTNSTGNQAVYTDLSNVTVIKRSPVTPLKLEMYRTSSSRVNTNTGIENPVSGLATGDFNQSGDPTPLGNVIEINFFEPTDVRPDDILILALQSSALDEDNNEDAIQDVRARVLADDPNNDYPFPGNPEDPNDISTGPFYVEVLSIQSDVSNSWGTNEDPWIVKLEDRDPLFNFKFPRFSYRYRYQDGEYSTFAPWSEIAFLPGQFDYQPKRGHNLGMKNQLRGLKLKNYHPSENSIPRDVVSIDLLYKETNKTAVYTVKTIRKSDAHPLWPDVNVDSLARGEFDLTTDMIHAVVPANQLLRPWDNVPKKALAQEITANRLVYGNYKQGYDVIKEPNLDVRFTHSDLDYQDNTFPLPSVKTMRDYQVGVVFSDRFGRETPVLTAKNSALRLDKKYSKSKNNITVNITSDSQIPSWAEYYSFYIKETSVEYYTLSMDRWYNASDGNIWLSFPSSERNKVMEEDFLILKKAHGSDVIVEEKAKYKILAIENEAPDFIKTRKTTLGKIIGTGNFQNDGFPLPGRREIHFDANAFTNEFGKSFIADRDYERLFVRIWAQGEASKLYEVTNIADSGWADSSNPSGFESNGNYRINLLHPLGEDLSITSTNETFGGAVDDVGIELYDYKVMNLPEFDGRFFVKIYKDDVLENYVANDEGIEYFIDMSWPLGYVNNNGYVNAGTRNSTDPALGDFGDDPGSTIYSGGYNGVIPNFPIYPYNNFNEVWVDIEAADSEWVSDWQKHYSNYRYGWSDRRARSHPTEHDWVNLTNDGDHPFEGATTTNYASGNRHKFLEDAWNGVGDTGLWTTYDKMKECNVRAINGAGGWGDFGSTEISGGTNDFTVGARSFWKRLRKQEVFWIDGATAAVYGGGRHPHTQDSINDGYWQDGRGAYGSNQRPGTRFKPTEWLTVGSGNDLPSSEGLDTYNNANALGFNQSGRYDQNFWGGNRAPNNATWETENSNAASDNNFSFEYPDPWSVSGSYALPNIEGHNLDIDVENYTNIHYDEWGLNDLGVGQADSCAESRGIPSRGIWTDQDKCYMDVSWCSWHERNNADNVESGQNGFVSHLKADADNTANVTSSMPATEAWAFMKKFVTPGTRFRFKRDPDQKVYTIKEFNSGSPYVGHLHDSNVYHISSRRGREWGAYGIRNVISGYSSDGSPSMTKREQNASRQYFVAYNNRQRWTVRVEPHIGLDSDCGYNPIHGTDPNLVTSYTDPNFRRALQHDGLNYRTGYDALEILTPFAILESSYSENPAIWETEPREAVELDIYYQASRLIPINLNSRTNEEYLPAGSTFTVSGYIQNQDLSTEYQTNTYTITSFDGTNISFTPNVNTSANISVGGIDLGDYAINNGQSIEFTLPGGTASVLSADAPVEVGDSIISINTVNLATRRHKLGWNNCWCFGNGVESDRIRDDFNAPQVDNGVKASATLADKSIREEHRKYGMIWSGLYNSTSGINETNQFLMAEKITKEVNPSHGSIQAMKARDTQIHLFCENKVLRAVTNKDALYNADGKPQLISSSAVVGDISAYKGDFGISKNPESLVTTPYSMYFTDVMRGKVLALSQEGVRAISEHGMKDYFADNMSSYVDKAIGTYDERKNEYNISLNKKYGKQRLPNEQITVSYSEKSKGWTSFKTFYTAYSSNPPQVYGLESGVSLNNNYYTFQRGHIWKHHFNETRNNFYGTQYASDVTVLFNDQPEAVKSFNTINYEGSQAKVNNWDDAGYGLTAGGTDGIGFYNNDSATGSGATVGTTTVNNVSDREYYNIPDTVKGWYVDNIATNLQSCGNLEFKDKEGKWFAYPTGDVTSLSNLDEREFSVQGLGQATRAHDNPDYGTAADPGSTMTITVNNNSQSNTGTNWD
jgi:hypothetical protein